MSLGSVLTATLTIAVTFLVGSALVEVASPYAIAIWATVTAGLLGGDGVVEGWLAALCVTYQTKLKTASRHLTGIGVPVRVLIKCLLAPLLMAHILVASLQHLADVYPYRPEPESEFFFPSKVLAGRYLCIAVLVVGLSSFQQAIWTPPESLAQKPVTLALLLIPCVLGWTMHEMAGAWVSRDETGSWTLHDAASLKTSHGWWKHRDRHYACAAIAYNAFLAMRRGQGGHGIVTTRSLESGYGAAKILLATHALAIAWSMIPAKHWPL